MSGLTVKNKRNSRRSTSDPDVRRRTSVLLLARQAHALLRPFRVRPGEPLRVKRFRPSYVPLQGRESKTRAR